MDNVRYNISPCTDGEVTAFIGKIDANEYVPNGAVKSTERSHYDRYSFLCNDNRVAVVYDTSAHILSITGRQDHAENLLNLFGAANKTVKRSTVPAQGSVPVKQANKKPFEPTEIIRRSANGTDVGKRAKLFVEPDRLIRRSEFKPVATVFASSKGAMISTDEIFPPQTVHKKQQPAPAPPVEDEYSGDVIYPPQRVQKRPLTSYGEKPAAPATAPQSSFGYQPPVAPRASSAMSEHGADNAKPVGIAISVSGRKPSALPRRAVISFGSDDESGGDDGAFRINTRGQSVYQSGSTANGGAQGGDGQKRKRGRPPKAKAQNDYVGGVVPLAQAPSAAQPSDNDGQKRKRGRPPKVKAQNDHVNVAQSSTEQSSEKAAPEYKNGYSVKNFPPEALSGAIKRLRSYGKTVLADGTEFSGTPQEVKTYSVTDAAGQKVVLRYATNRRTLQLQGKRSDLFGEVLSQVSHDTDYSSALENYIDNSGGSDKKVSDVQNKLKRRLPTAFEYLSEQSRIDFSYGIHDFGQTGLQLSDYSVLLVPAFRGLERFVFDLQRTQGINVKMIGQAYDKDDSGNYVLKSGYTQRINSVIYAEVMVSLYTEYFARRNFFAHSDNTDNNVSRSIPDRDTAKKIFDGLLDVVEYNAKKLKEIGFKIAK
ncbi:MAG: hypothetical protein K2L54_05700 [Clostridiales bacterium]|nr:hypothetical protein [Clostridiales bacterium]